jgi:heat shock protein HslJ
VRTSAAFENKPRVEGDAEAMGLAAELHYGRQPALAPRRGRRGRGRAGADGKVSGSAGCNDYNGTYTAQGTSLSFSPLRTTRKACPPDILAEETRFLAARAHVARHQLGQRELDLFDAGGARMATLVSRP